MKNVQLLSLQWILCVVASLTCLCSCSNNNSPIDPDEANHLKQSELLDNELKVVSMSSEEKAYIKWQNFFDAEFCTDPCMEYSGDLINSLDKFLNLSFACNYLKTPEDIKEVFLAKLINHDKFVIKEEFDSTKLNLLSRKIIDYISTADKANPIVFNRSVWGANCIDEIKDETRYNNLNDYYGKVIFPEESPSSTEITQWINSNLSSEFQNIYKLDMSLICKAHICVSELKPSWKYDFTKVESKAFNNLDGSTKMVEMMSNPDVFYKVFEVENVGNVVEVPLGNGAFSVFFMFDDEKGTAVKALRNELQPIGEKIENSKYHLATFKMPVFKMSTCPDYKDWSRNWNYVGYRWVELINEDISLSELQYCFSAMDFKPVGPYKSISTKGSMGNSKDQKGAGFVLDRPFSFLVIAKLLGVVIYEGHVVAL